ncbi:MAG: glycosyl hydrolase family 18 protein [Defluviitaleaceae bacterium]|nr:glycosyl hydrolase family 18 protein [Defluviitaleaceae bacterium]
MNRQAKMAFVGFITTLLIVGGLALLVIFVIIPAVQDMDIMPNLGSTNRNVVDFHTHFNLNPNVPQLVLDGQRMTNIQPPLVEYQDGVGHVYLRFDFLREYIDPFLFWDNGAGVFFASTRYDMMEFTPNSHTFLLNDSVQSLEVPIRRMYDMVYVPAALLHGLYAITIDYHPEYNMVVITSANQLQSVSTVSVARADIRYWGGNNAPITAQVGQGTQLFVFPESENSNEVWIRVRTPHGLLGYVERSSLDNIYEGYLPLDREPILHDWVNNFQHHPPNWQEGVPVNMTWDAIYHVDANVNRMQLPLHPSLNVISPQWFRIDPAGTHINSIASRAYVDWAHSHDVYVWPKVFDVDNGRVRDFLFEREHRRHAIEQLIDFVETYNLDGLNIDFEHLTATQGPYKVQFLRELAIPMRQRGVVLSTAVLVPLPDTTFYRRDLIALTVDFVQVMTYDQHWGVAAGVGPNASLPWVEWGVNNMLNGIAPEFGVPANQLIMGLPFYSRVWREVSATNDLSQRALYMDYARNFMEERNVNWVWDDSYGSYFGEAGVIEDNEFVTYRVWLEDPRSIGAKMQIVLAHDLAGVASWRRGMETPETWDTISHYLGIGR